MKAEAGNGYVHLTWDRLTQNNDGYVVYRSPWDASAPYQWVEEIYSVDQNYYTDTAVQDSCT